MPKVSGQAEAPSGPAFTARQALRTSAFWLLSLGHACSLLVVMAINVHAVTHMKEGLGYTLAQATLFFVLVTVGQFFGVIIGWLVGEKFAKRKVAAACMLMHAGGMLLLTYAPGRLSMITGWPQVSRNFCDNTRPTRSFEPPGVNGTMMRIGLLGYTPAANGVEQATARKAATGSRSLKWLCFIGICFYWVILNQTIWREQQIQRHLPQRTQRTQRSMAQS